MLTEADAPLSHTGQTAGNQELTTGNQQRTPHGHLSRYLVTVEQLGKTVHSPVDVLGLRIQTLRHSLSEICPTSVESCPKSVDKYYFQGTVQ